MKRIKKKTGTVLKLLLILAVVLSGILGTYAEPEVRWDPLEEKTGVSVEHQVFHYKNDCITKESSRDSLHRQEKRKVSLLSWGLPVSAVCAAFGLYFKRESVCREAADGCERRYALWKRRGPPLSV